MPEIQYDPSGRAWVRDAGGQWAPADAPLVPPLQPPFEHKPMMQGPLSQSAAYGFPPAFGPASSAGRSIPIDPRLVALPQGNDHDLSNPHTIAKASLHPADKVAGIRQKSKGKKHHHSSDSSDDSDAAPPTTKRGRPQGSTNFSKEDLKKFLEILETLRPLGQKGWKRVVKRYNKWAKSNGRSERDFKSLDAKYKKLLQTKKPTGDAKCPSEVKRAHAIEASINHRADTRTMSDSESGSSSDDDDVVEVAASSTAVHTVVARRAPSPPIRHARTNAPGDLVNQISKVFDPQVQRTRDAERAERSSQTTHVFFLTQQLRDANATVDSLRNQITIMQNRVHEVERARDRAEWKLEVAQSQPGGAGSSGPAQSRSAVYKENTDLVRVDGKVRCEHFYPDGGACTQWFSDPSDDEKENYDPGSSSRSQHPSTSSRHSSSQYDNFSDFSAPFEIGRTVSPLPSETAGSSMAAGDVASVVGGAD